MRFAVIGAGMAGILSAIKLDEAGLTDFTVYEKGDRVGGTWRENTYPGLACDVPSHLYSYSFALTPEWSHRFSPGPEIEALLRAGREGPRRHPLHALRRRGHRLHVHDGRWHLRTASGHTDEVDVVIAATGVLHHPRYPDIEGLDSFAGAMFHSARWDHSVTIDGARVGVIGTGSTAVQIVSAITDRVEKLTMFQRTAQWIMPQENPAYTDDEKAAFRSEPEPPEDPAHQPGRGVRHLRQRRRRLAFGRDQDDRGRVPRQPRGQRARPGAAGSAPADYRAACKRLIISPNFYDAIQQPNAELVTEQIERIEPGGVRTSDGRLHELDVLVLATGFKADAFMRPMRITGRDGLTLEQAWTPRPEAYLSISIPDFPNFFMLNGPNGPVGNFSLIEVAELQFGYIMQLVEQLRSGACREINPTRAALDEFEAERTEAAQNTCG